MLNQPTPWFFLTLEIVFFTGIAGCLLVVLISWISIFSSGFSRDHDPGLPVQPHRPLKAR